MGQDLGDVPDVPSGAPVRGLRDEVPQKLKYNHLIKDTQNSDFYMVR